MPISIQKDRFEGFSFTSLPCELQEYVLTFLPIRSLLSFAGTSRRHYQISASALKTLHLSVLPKRFHCVLALLTHSNPDYLVEPDLHQVVLPMNQPNAQRKDRSSYRPSSTTRISSRRSPIPGPINVDQALNASFLPVILRQTAVLEANAVAAEILSTAFVRGSLLQHLVIHTTSLQLPKLSKSLSQLSHLQSLVLNFSHPFVNVSYLPGRYWTTTPLEESLNGVTAEGTSAWNSIAGLDEPNVSLLKCKSLRQLEIKRAATNEMQLSSWVSNNPRLKNLKLSMVSGVRTGFVHALDMLCRDNQLRLSILELEECPNLELKDPDSFGLFDAMVMCGMQELSFYGCVNVSSDALKRHAEEAGWFDYGLTRLTSPDETYEDGAWESEVKQGLVVDSTDASLILRSGRNIEVDPHCR